MDRSAWALFALTAAIGLAVAVALYRFREPPGPGRPALVLLRWLALALILLLLFNPTVPVGRDATPPMPLLDRSLSMALGRDTTPWVDAVAAVRRTSANRVTLFGDTVRTVPVEALDTLQPTAQSSMLEPALRAAAEAGARSVVVWTDGRIADARRADRLARDLGLTVELRRLDVDVRDFAVVELDAPAWTRGGDPAAVQVGVAARSAADGDSVRVELMDDGRTVARVRLPAPDPGRVATARLSWTPDAPAGGRLAHLQVRLTSGDAVPDNDVRTAYTRVTEQPAGTVLVSFLPDWEPRFLAPALARSLGAPVAAYLSVGGGRYLVVGSGEEVGRMADDTVVRAAVRSAELLVVHGWTENAPGWAQEAVERAGRLLLLLSGPRAPGTPLEAADALSGEWYLRADPPASPLAGLLAGLRVDGLPPLVDVRLLNIGPGGWPAVMVSRSPTGVAVPGVVAGTTEGRRWVVATGRGYWRWSFYGARGRAVYGRLWSALAGWLVERLEEVRVATAGPVERVVRRGEAVRWEAAGSGADSLRIQVTGETVVDTVLEGMSGRTMLPPGDYRYVVTAMRAGDVVARGAGPLTVDRYLPEWTRDVAGPVTGRTGGPAPVAERRPVPMRALAWPYLLLVLAFSLEWTLRRWWGLR